MNKPGQSDKAIRWIITGIITLLLVLCAFPVSGFNVTVPNDTVNRWYQDDTIVHTYAEYTSYRPVGDTEVVRFFPGNYSYPDPWDAWTYLNESWHCPLPIDYLWEAGTFPVVIEGRPYEVYDVGWILCDVGMTGKVCDRPPLLMPSTYPEIEFDPSTVTNLENALIGKRMIYPEADCCMVNGMRFWEAVPNGQLYPSKGDWDVPYNGTRYYSQVTADGCGLAIVMVHMDQTVKEGTYKLHIQQKDYNPGVGGEYGYVNAFIKVQKGKVTGPKYSVLPYADKSITIEGENYDSDFTYLWITGQNLPKCGVNLEIPDDVHPTVVNVTGHGRWEYSWDPNQLYIGPGSYEIWYSSVDPNDPNQRDCITCANSNLNGICALKSGELNENCIICGNYDYYTASLTYPRTTAKIPEDIERCCCPGAACDTIGGAEEIWLRGISEGDFTGNVVNKTLQIWLFGEGMVGDKPFLFKEVNYLCDGSFDYELNKGLLQENGVKLCDLAPGKYYVLVQPTMYNDKFDVTLQGSTSYAEGINEGAVPVNEAGQRYVVSSSPVKWSKSFVISGIDAYKGVDALNALKAAIDDPTVDDQYAVDPDTEQIPFFVIQDNKCAKSVDFSGDPLIGYAPLTVDFIGKASFEVKEWEWDFNDDGVIDATVQNASHQYLNPGIYTVKIKATDVDGTVRDNVKYSYVVVKELKADFMFVPNPGNTSYPVQFLDKSTGKPTSWEWNFGDGTTSTMQSPSHQYAESGIYDVSLFVGDSIGTSEKTVKKVPVYDELNSDFSIDPEYSPSYPVTISCTDLSTGTIQNWKWEFIRDGKVTAVATEKNPEVIFNEPGIYDVSLTISNSGHIDTLLKAGILTVGSGNAFKVSKGWNHVSVPKKVGAAFDTVEKLFAGIDTGGVPYAVFNNAGNEWVNVSDEYPVRPLEALRVYKNDEGTVTITPELIDDGIYTKNLSVGWNGIGIMAMQPIPANIALASLGDSWNKTLSYNPYTQRWEYPIIRGIDDDKTMDPTVGYLIEMNSDGVLIGGESE